ncbi:hypothetical protein [Amycolatopsis albispora]|uniref:Uncharacterized protein n=1 Tax=Amycolatopsis albispora TaxID=1804986 RepID=A0A344LIT9_9PSEU|nr:hypothetical protein [Amycolatopsis albispora]AXB47963.1 hypothetical protein A4R43_40555 [Amycolatopsis albispora]
MSSSSNSARSPDTDGEAQFGGLILCFFGLSVLGFGISLFGKKKFKPRPAAPAPPGNNAA